MIPVNRTDISKLKNSNLEWEARTVGTKSSLKADLVKAAAGMKSFSLSI